MNNLISALFSSKKTWIAISSIVIPIIARLLDVDEVHVKEIWVSLLALLGGVSLQDLGKAKK
jgi:hypothetical protein|tara:strand:- start:2752 stop:2937 length:186 start_codon:yes stop_codon:yes gene_type:complete